MPSLTAFEKMRLRENQGASIRDERIFAGRDIVDTLLPNDPSYKETVKILGKGFINLRMNNYKVLAGLTPQMNIQSTTREPITFALGDVFFYDDSYWICVEANNRHGVEHHGTVEECNYYIQWQNPKTLEIHGRWCSVRDPFTVALDERARVIVTGNTRYRVKMPHDSETALLHVDKRFLMGLSNNKPMPYTIISYDPITTRYAARTEGFLIMTLRESQIEEDDNWDLMIANYKAPGFLTGISHVSDMLNGSCEIRFNNAPVVRAGGSAKPFYGIIFDDNGSSIDFDAPVNWELDLPPELSLGQVSIVSQEGNQVKLCAVSDAKIGSSFVLRMSIDDMAYGSFKAELTVSIGGII